MTTEIETLVTRGTRVRVRRAGKGKPVLFLHGAGGWPTWLPFFERLAQRFAVKPFVAMKKIDDAAREAKQQHALIGGEAIGINEIGPRRP